MNKIKALKWICTEMNKHYDYFKKVIEALTIIKTKGVDITNLKRFRMAEDYNCYKSKLATKRELTKEEFNLLKEVLI